MQCSAKYPKNAKIRRYVIVSETYPVLVESGIEILVETIFEINGRRPPIDLVAEVESFP